MLLLTESKITEFDIICHAPFFSSINPVVSGNWSMEYGSEEIDGFQIDLLSFVELDPALSIPIPEFDMATSVELLNVPYGGMKIFDLTPNKACILLLAKSSVFSWFCSLSLV